MKLVVTTFITMDGIVQAPGGPQEDTSNGFEYGGWIVPFADDVMGETIDAWFERASEFLLGRGTYEIFASYWPRVTDPNHTIAQKLNNLPKHVASRTLRRVDWQNSRLIEGDVVEAVKELKSKPGGELQVHGSPQLVQTLFQNGLVDEFRPIMFPVVLGTGKRLFGEGTVPTAFETVECRTTSTGAIITTLRPTGAPTTGEFSIELEEGVGAHTELTSGRG
jgi:dihydrofolate reductase